jgi:hypothetical protein
MNIPLRAPCDQSDLLREPGDVIADVAQRDLFEYFAPPLTEAGSPPLAADHLPPAASPNEVTAVGDEDVAWHDQILRWHEEIQDDAISHHEPQSPDEPDETAAYDRIASATRSEAAALDEASKADLSRLEATLSWLQSEVEACRLPPAPTLPRVSGLPVVEPIFDRDALDRTPLRRTPPLPAWLREAPPAPQLAPPRSGGASWPGAIKFLVASAIAAPLSYYFAVATAPVHKRLAEIVGLASSDAPLAGPPELRDGWRMSMAAPQSVPTAQAPALASERIVEASASVDLPRADAAIRPSTDLPVAEAPAIPGLAVPAQAVQFECPGHYRAFCDRGCRRRGAIRSAAGGSGSGPGDRDDRAAGRETSDRPGQAALRRRRSHRRADPAPSCRQCRRCGGDGRHLRSRRSG